MHLSTPELWKEIPAFEGFYEVSIFGRVRSISRLVTSRGGVRSVRGRILKPSIDSDGYLLVSVSNLEGQVTLPVHRLVMLAFVGPKPRDLQTRHLDGNKLDCSLGNLKYGTPLENWEDRRKHGSTIGGLSNPNAKLTVAERNEIQRIGHSASYASTSRLFGVSDCCVRSIILKG